MNKSIITQLKEGACSPKYFAFWGAINAVTCFACFWMYAVEVSGKSGGSSVFKVSWLVIGFVCAAVTIFHFMVAAIAWVSRPNDKGEVKDEALVMLLERTGAFGPDQKD